MMTFKQPYLLLLYTLFISNILFAQIKPINIGVWDEILDGFEYNGIIYKTKSKDLKRFMNDVEMNQQLRDDLYSQYKSIRTKERVSKAVFYSSLGASVYFFVNGILNSNKYDSSQEDKAGRKIEKGAITAISAGVIGTLVHIIIKPKKRHYLNFINSFNKKERNLSINFKLNYTK